MRALRHLLATVAIIATLGGSAIPATAVVVDGIAAVVNGEVITLLELEKAGRLALEERLRTVPSAEQDRVRREILAPILDQLVLTRLQAQLARRLGIHVSTQEVDAAIATIREENRMSEELLARVLQERGLSQEEYRRDIEDQIRLSKLVQREIRSRITVTDAEAAAWFAEHRMDWHRPEKIRFRHLLVAIPPGASADEIEAARAKALSLLARARAGEDFATLVRAETAEPGSGADPVSGEIARGELFPALEDAAFALTVGGISEPVQSPAGFHLVQLAEKTPAYEPTLEEVRASIEQKIVDRKTRARYEDWLKQLRTDAIIEIRY
jgi:peptidyl-prolyl cis-trans isomerase SurA